MTDLDLRHEHAEIDSPATGAATPSASTPEADEAVTDALGASTGDRRTADSPDIATAQPPPLPCGRYPECRRECLWPDCPTGGAS